MTLQLLQTTIYDYLEDKSMLSVVDSLAKPSVLPESDWDSQKLEELCSSKLLDSPKKSNHNIYSLKTSKAYSITTEGTHLEQSSPLDELGYDAEWQVLNSKDFESHKIEKGCSLLDILEDQWTRSISYQKKNTTAIEIIGYLSDGYKDVNYVLDPSGISKCLLTMGGGNREPKVLVRGNVNPSGNGMNGNVYESEGLAPTLTTNKGEGPKVLVKEATKQGYAIAEIGDSINLSVPNSKTRRGRVGKGCPNIRHIL